MKFAALCADPMGASPVFVQEVRSRMRKPWAFWAMLGYLAVLIPATLYIFYRYQHATPETMESLALLRAGRQTGVIYAMALFAVQFLLISLLSPALTCAAFAGDRARRTLTFLLLTPLPSREIVTGKLQMHLVYHLLLLLASAPLCALSSLFGGLHPLDLLAGAAVLVTYALLVTAFGLYMSARQTRAAIAALYSYLGVLALPVLLPFMAAPCVGLYLLLAHHDRGYLLELVDGGPLLLVAAMLALLFWLAATWFRNETATLLDYERRMWGTYAPPLRLDAPPLTRAPIPPPRRRRW